MRSRGGKERAGGREREREEGEGEERGRQRQDDGEGARRENVMRDRMVYFTHFFRV